MTDAANGNVDIEWAIVPSRYEDDEWTVEGVEVSNKLDGRIYRAVFSGPDAERFARAHFEAATREGGVTTCYECDSELVGPFCPVCNFREDRPPSAPWRVVDEFVLVPREPTLEMVEAGEQAGREHWDDEGDYAKQQAAESPWWPSPARFYRAMLVAAPPPPATGAVSRPPQAGG